jgi:ribosomal protein L30/L7E
MKKNEEMIIQIDNLLNEFSSSMNGNQKSNKLVYYNENTQINEMITSKNDFISELGYKRTELLNIDTFIKKISSVTNVQNTKNINGKLKFVLPLILIFGFILVRFFIRFYKKQEILLELNQ